MLKRMSIRKIIITSLTLLVLLIIYLIPSSPKELDLSDKQNLEYVYSNNLGTIYLIDSEDYVARTKIVSCACEKKEDKAKDLIEGLIIDGTKSSIIPNGFRSIIPPGTKILNISLTDKILKIDFSKDILEINSKYEEKMLEAIVWTLTSIDGIDGVIIYVEGELFDKLPNSLKNLPTFFDKSYGINKVYELTSMNNVDSWTVFYVSEYNGNNYYVPVTKYINNDNQDKIKVLIDELTSAPIYESNLMSFLNVQTKLIDYEIIDKTIKLNFNDMILNDISTNKILEEVLWTISLSIEANSPSINEVVFYVDNEEICKSVLKDIE